MRIMVTAFTAVAVKAISDLEKTVGAGEQATTNFVRLICRSLKA